MEQQEKIRKTGRNREWREGAFQYSKMELRHHVMFMFCFGMLFIIEVARIESLSSEASGRPMFWGRVAGSDQSR